MIIWLTSVLLSNSIFSSQSTNRDKQTTCTVYLCVQRCIDVGINKKWITCCYISRMRAQHYIYSTSMYNGMQTYLQQNSIKSTLWFSSRYAECLDRDNFFVWFFCKCITLILLYFKLSLLFYNKFYYIIIYLLWWKIMWPVFALSIRNYQITLQPCLINKFGNNKTTSFNSAFSLTVHCLKMDCITIYHYVFITKMFWHTYK